MMRIVFMGSGAFGVPTLEAITGGGHELAGIVSQPDRPAGRGKELTPTPVSAWALAKGVRLERVENVNDAAGVAMLRGFEADILVVIAFGQKLSDEVLATAERGGINLHSSLLPKYRGAAPINWAIINGDKTAGVSVIEVMNVMDGGDVFATAETPVGASETAGELHDRLAVLGAPVMINVLNAIAAGTAQRLKQDKALASKAPKLKRELAWVDLAGTAEAASARVRGLSPWPGVQLELIDPTGKPRVTGTLVKCEAVAGNGVPGEVTRDGAIACGVGALKIHAFQPMGKRAMTVSDLVNGYKFGAGWRVRSVVTPPAAAI